MLKRFVALALSVFIGTSLLFYPLTVYAATGNLLANPSAEYVSNGSPLNWTPNSWGSETSSLSLTTDSHSGTYGLLVTTTARTSGDAKWMPDSVAVTAGHSYAYTDYYKSTVATEVDAAYYDASGAVSYYYLATVPASTTWQAAAATFTAPATAVRVVVMHILANVGSLTTDDFSLIDTSSPTPPPTSGNLIANASFEIANGTTPANWSEGGWGTNAANFAFQTTGHTGIRSVRVDITSYTSGDAKWYFNPVAITAGGRYTYTDYYIANAPTTLVAQFTDGSGALSYQTLGSVPTATSWTQSSAQFTAPASAAQVTIFHVISSVGSLQLDDASLAANTTSGVPIISLTSPASGTTISGTAALSATASAPQGISGVQFFVDGSAVGAPVTGAPYQLNWDTASVANGNHPVSAVATATDGQTASSGTVQVTVANIAAAGNLILNPSVEIVDPANSKLPLNWTKGGWGTNTRSFAYLTSGHTGTHSIKTTISSFTSGAAYWSPTEVPVLGGQTYDFSDYYESNIGSEVDLTFTMSDGSFQYQYIGTAFPSPKTWTKFRSQFTAPSGAVSVGIYHDIFAVGWLTTDDFSLTSFSYQGFSRPIISITDDDAYASFYNNGLPLLQKYGLTSTDYIITGAVDNDPGYMTSAMVKTLYASGQEIGSHTVTHPDLTTLTATKMDSELKNSQTFLQTLLGVPITDFAAPYGAYNDQVVTDAQKYYQSFRTVQEGYNARNNFDPYHLQVQNLISTTTLAEVQSWIAEAQATHTWLILVYHQVDPDPAAGEYNTYPSDFDGQLSAIKASGIPVETVSQALKEVTPQL